MTQSSASLWGDESFAAILAQKSLRETVRIVAHDTSPPLYYLCLHFWMKLFGPSEIAIRSLSFLLFLETGLVGFSYRQTPLGQKNWSLGYSFNPQQYLSFSLCL